MFMEEERTHVERTTGRGFVKSGISLSLVIGSVLIVVVLLSNAILGHNVFKLEDDQIASDCVPPNWPNPIPNPVQKLSRTEYNGYDVPLPHSEVAGNWFTEIHYLSYMWGDHEQYYIEYRTMQENRVAIATAKFSWISESASSLLETVPLCTWIPMVETNNGFEGKGYGRYSAMLAYGDMFNRGHVTPQNYFVDSDLNWDDEEKPDETLTGQDSKVVDQTFGQYIIKRHLIPTYGGQIITFMPQPKINQTFFDVYFQWVHWFPTKGPRR